MSSVWDERAEAYRRSEEHREGEDLELIVEWARGAKTALDVASGGGHVARRLRVLGVEVVTCDPSPGMQADVLCRAESLPFADGSFDVVTCRLAGHHFEDVRAGVAEMARVARERVLLVDNLWMSEQGEEANRLRDPSHVRNYTEAEWTSFFEDAGLEIEDVRTMERAIRFDPWLERTGCTGDEAARVHKLLHDRIDDGFYRLERIALEARKGRHA
ncbi:MAG TPA: class I SAM-dependent methyltransferase [Gaiellaceae bacterium]